jgi:hypothetical protein
MIEVMQSRHSVRRFTGEPLSQPEWAGLRRGISEVTPLDPSVSLDLSLLTLDEAGGRLAVGAVLTFNPAPAYLIVHGPPQEGRMEEAGFRGEQAVLAATALGLGTCWIGGMLGAGTIAKRLGRTAADMLAISPVGHPAPGRLGKLSNSATEAAAKSGGRRKPLESFCFWQSWGQSLEPGQASPEVYRALELARLAPSWSNVQPWYFLADEGGVWAIGDSHPQRANNRPGKPYYRLDVGIAMSHFWLAMRDSGDPGKWQPLRGQETELQARLGLPEIMVPIAQFIAP